MTRVERIRLDNFRLYESLDIAPHERLNFITGSNAAGKTTLLEALFHLGRGRSFRAMDAGEIAGPKGRYWSAFAMATNTIDVADRLGAGWSDDGQQNRINGNRARAADMARLLPVQLIDPVGHRLIEEGPGYRRSYLDWGVFHVEHQFLGFWQRYNRALKQRNTAIRSGQSDSAVMVWDRELVESGMEVTAARRRHVSELQADIEPLVETLIGVSGAKLTLGVGWNAQHDFAQVLRDQLAQHRRLGLTTQGPQRAELKLTLGEQKAKGRVSRGQQKLLVAALVLAQCTILARKGQQVPLLLVDDFSAELSPEYQRRFADVLKQYAGQKFVTAFERPEAFGPAESRVFHVEHGRIDAS